MTISGITARYCILVLGIMIAGAHTLRAEMPLPADADGAAAALKASPRHTEYVDLDAPGLDRTPSKTFVAYPERSDPAPVVIVIHEIYGLSDWIKAVADQLAAEGFIAIAPDFISGKGTRRWQHRFPRFAYGRGPARQLPDSGRN
jgi:carboxymethylenebutenolidase